MKPADPGRIRDLEQYVWKHFSPYAYVSSFDRNNSKAGLGIQIQQIVPDQSEQGPTMKFYELDDVVTCKWRRTRKGLRISGVTSSSFAHQVQTQYRRILLRSQNALLPSLYKRLVQIPTVRHAMSPLERIITAIHIESRAAPEDIFEPRRIPSAMRYFALLDDLDMIKQEDGYYVGGPRMKHLEGENQTGLYSAILGEALEKRSKYMKEVLRWSMLGPYLQWSNAYYFPAFQAERLVEA